MWGIGPLGPVMAIGGLIGLVIWIAIMVWLSERIMRFIGLRTGWRPLDLRNMLATTALMVGAIHLGNYAVDWMERSLRGLDGPFLRFPSAFLIAGVAISVGIAAIRWNRRHRRR